MATNTSSIADNTPIIVGVGQHVLRLTAESTPPFDSPMALAAVAARTAMNDAGVKAADIDTIAVIRLFADAAKAWASPFGGSNNPPESLARQIGATPRGRIYSNASGAQPLQVLMEMFLDIARGERELVLLAGAEVIASQRFALRHGFEADWTEEFDLPLDDREYLRRMASKEELRSGLLLPTHYYALIENAQAHSLGHTNEEHREHMARLMAPFSTVAANNPYSQNPREYSAEELVAVHRGNYSISHPLTKLLVAQDAVNQSAALLLTSAGKARELGIDPERWIFVEAYAEGEDRYLSQRADIGRSAAMERVFEATLEMAEGTVADMSRLDLYSCFPCAVHAARTALNIEDDRALTITGGLPYFGGPGNNYVSHALAEMAMQLRDGDRRGLITANGGILSKHAAAILSPNPQDAGRTDWANYEPVTIAPESIPARPYCEAPERGNVISYTVIDMRDGDDVGVVLCEDGSGARFLASCTDTAVTQSMRAKSPIGSEVLVTTADQRHQFRFG